MTEFGNLALVEERLVEEAGMPKEIALPGARKGDMSSRRARPEIRVSCVRFSPTGRAFAATTTEGVVIYSLDHNLVFDPYEFGEEVTPEAISAFTASGDHARALVMALRFNESAILKSTLEATPIDSITVIVESLSQLYAEKLLNFLAGALESTKYIELYVTWTHIMLMKHGESLKERSKQLMGTLRTLQKNLTLKLRDLSSICDHNLYAADYLLTISKSEKVAICGKGESDEGSESEEEMMLMTS